MKKYLLVIVMALAMVGASAQSYYDSDISGIGVGVGGMTFGASTVTGVDGGMKFSWSFKVLNLMYRHKAFITGTGAAIKLKGVSSPKDLGIDNKNLNAWYFGFPVYVGAIINTSDESAVHIKAGPVFNVGFAGSSVKYDDGTKWKYFDNAKKFDLGIAGEVGWSYKMIGFFVRGEYGTSKVFKEFGGHNMEICGGLSLIL